LCWHSPCWETFSECQGGDLRAVLVLQVSSSQPLLEVWDAAGPVGSIQLSGWKKSSFSGWEKWRGI